MSQYLPVLAANRSTNIRIDGQKVPSVAQYLSSITQYPLNVQAGPVYVNISDVPEGGLPAWKEIASHVSIGQLLVVGPITGSNATVVVVSGGVVTAGTGLTVNVSAGELRNRNTGVYVAGASATNSTISSNSSGNPRIDLVTWNNTTGAVLVTAGTPAASPKAPSAPAGTTPLATVAVANGASVPGTITDVRPRQ